jgi:ABC-type multidrug transport system fused ATPase/permease subunit
MVLDDATSAIDAEVEAEILSGLRASDIEATVVMVASRASTISLADEVIHLQQGRVVGRGTHRDLVAHSTDYAALVEAYARDAARRWSAPDDTQNTQGTQGTQGWTEPEVDR